MGVEICSPKSQVIISIGASSYKIQLSSRQRSTNQLNIVNFSYNHDSYTIATMCSGAAMSKQSDGNSMYNVLTDKSCVQSLAEGDLCVLGGIYVVYSGSARYTTYTDWI